MNKEKEKYEWIAENRPGYGSSFHGEDMVPLLRALASNVGEGAASILDLGTGHGQLCEAMCGYYKRIYGLDWVIKPDPKFMDIQVDPDFPNSRINFIEADATDIPLPDKSVDITTSFDFFEHIHPSDVGKVIREVNRVTKHLSLHRIAFNPSGSFKKELEAVLGDGELHPSAHNAPWWRDELGKHCEKVYRVNGAFLLLHKL